MARAQERRRRATPAAGAARQHVGDEEAEKQVSAEEDLEEGDRSRQEGGQGELPGPSVLFVSGQGHEGAQGEAQGRDDGVGIHEGQEQVAPQDVGPPVGLEVRGEEEGEIGQKERPRGQRHRRRRSPEAGHQGPDGEDQGEGPDGDVEAGQRVPGARADPAQGRGADEIGAEMVAKGEAGHTRDLRGIAGDQLVGDTHVKRRIERDEGVEKKIPGGSDPVPAVVGEGEEGDDGGEGHERPAQGRPRCPAPGDPGKGQAERGQAEGGRKSQGRPLARLAQ